MNSKIEWEWLESALGDIKNIEHIIDDEYLTHIVAFHSQQCIEKCFKAILESQSMKVPKEHSTIKLYGLVKDTLKTDIDYDLLTDMDDLYINSRYPSDFGLMPQGKPTLENAKEFYEFALKVYEEVGEILGR
ncbi:MAG: HEPN domain-containing protein [Candidatus Marinimicrobia bacterium]|nr:HEPN domain-containing protein [Candidatus Neomarinimicrobiota bacterium]MCH7763895.1 HEPN domain-containing protein [Candidatus Neomarinimicrobiota bacterium]